MVNRIFIALLVVSLVGGLTAGENKTDKMKKDYHHKAGTDIIHTATRAGSFSTLIAAIDAAGLTETLMGDGPFTVFAPSDDAFAKLPEGTVADLLKPENRDKLVSVLTYHVVPGKVSAGDVIKLNSAKTVQGSEVKINVDEGNVMIDTASVVKTDIMASNGIIHVIDSVIMPN